MPRVDRSTIWPYDLEGEPREFFYSRYAHPNGAEAEARLGEREGGQALLFASGMAAETAVVLTFARPGSLIALAKGAYFGTSVLFGSLAEWGLRFVEYDQTGPPPAEADIVWVESPANPVLTVPDWDAVRAHDGLDRVRLDGRDAGLPPRARRRAQMSSSTRRRSSSPEATMLSAAPSSSAIPSGPTRCAARGR